MTKKNINVCNSCRRFNRFAADEVHDFVTYGCSWTNVGWYKSMSDYENSEVPKECVFQMEQIVMGQERVCQTKN